MPVNRLTVFIRGTNQASVVRLYDGVYSMPEKKDIFRKVSLERLSSPEQLDQLIQIVPPRGWLALIGIGCLLATVCLWGFFGSIPIRVFGQGIIMNEEGIFTIIARGDGVIEKLHVDVGDEVSEGQLIVSVTQTELIDDIQKNETLLIDLKEEFKIVNLECEKGEELLEENEISAIQYYDIQEKRISLKIEIDHLEGKIKSQRDTLEEISEIKSPYSGIIFELEVSEGMSVEKNMSIGRIELPGAKLQAIMYFSPADGKKIIKSMNSHISPTSIKQEEYGFMKGKVVQISLYPMTKAGIMRTLQNELLVDRITRDEDPIEVKINLITDSNTPSGYSWSSSVGPPVEIHSGTMCDGNVTIANQRPINLVIPLFNK